MPEASPIVTDTKPELIDISTLVKLESIPEEKSTAQKVAFITDYKPEIIPIEEIQTRTQTELGEDLAGIVSPDKPAFIDNPETTKESSAVPYAKPDIIGDVQRAAGSLGLSLSASAVSAARGIRDILPSPALAIAARVLPKSEYLEKVKEKIGLAGLEKSVNSKLQELAEETEAYRSQIGEEIRQEGGLASSVAQNIVNAATENALTLGVLGITGFVGKGATVRQAIKEAAKFGGLTYARTPGTPEEKLIAAARSTAYMLTPIPASRLPKDWLANAGNIILNVGVGALSGDYSFQRAREIATGRGTPNEWLKEWVGMVAPSVAMDTIFGSLTKSAKTGNKKAQEILSSMPPELKERIEPTSQEMAGFVPYGAKLNLPPATPEQKTSESNRQILLNKLPARPTIINLPEEQSAALITELNKHDFTTITPDLIKEIVGRVSSSTAKQSAPVEYKGEQEDGLGGKLPIYTLTEDIPGHVKGSTVFGKTLEREGFLVPEHKISPQKTEPVKQPSVKYFHVLLRDLSKFGINEKESRSLLEASKETGNKGRWGKSDDPERMNQEQQLAATRILQEKLSELRGTRQKPASPITIPEKEKPVSSISSIGETEIVNDVMSVVRGIRNGDIKAGLLPVDRVELQGRVPESIKKLDPEGTIINKVLDSLNYPLPLDPEERRKASILVDQYVEQAVRAKINAENKEQRSLMHRFTRIMRGFASQYHEISDISADTANPALYTANQRRVANHKLAVNLINNERKTLYNKTGITHATDAYIASKPKLSQAVRIVMGVDPKTSDQTLQELQHNAEAMIDSDPKSAEIKKVISVAREYTQGKGAVEVRMLKINEFGALWNKLESAKSELRSVSKELNRTKDSGQRSELENRMATFIKERDSLERAINLKLAWFAEAAPLFPGEVPKTPKQISITDALKAWNILQDKGPDALRSYLSKEKWGTRKYYFMSQPDPSDYVNDTFAMASGELPKLSETEFVRTVPVTGSIQRRTSLPSFREGGSPLHDLWRHFTNLRVQNDTFRDTGYMVEALNKAVNDGYISKAQARGLLLGMKTDWGGINDIHPVAQAAYAVGRPAWTAFSLILNKLGYYTARNIGYQGVPWGALATVHNAPDIMEVATRKNLLRELSDPDSNVRAFIKERWPSISEDQARFLEAQMMFTPGELAKYMENNKNVASAVSKLWEIQSEALGFSDNIARFMTVVPSYLITQRYINRFNLGKINRAQLEHGLRLDSMPVAIRLHLYNMFSEGIRTGNFEPFVREVAEQKTLIANYAYGTTERSAFEQDPDFRMILGMTVFPRGTIEQIYRPGIEPLIKEFNNWKSHGFKSEFLDVGAVQSAWRNIASNVITRALSTAILGAIIGERIDYDLSKRRGKMKTVGAFNLTDSIMGYDIGGLGGSLAYNLFDAGKEVVSAMSKGDEDDVKRAWKTMGDRALFFTAIIPTLKSVFEAVGDRRGMRNTDVVLSMMKGKMVGGEPVPDRGFYGALMHVLFDTEPIDSDKEVVEMYKKIKGFLEKK